MASYKVNRRILIDFRAYNPGSEIELTDARAKEFKNGQVTRLPAKAEAVEAAVESTEPAKAAEEQPEIVEPAKAEPGTEEETAPVK